MTFSARRLTIDARVEPLSLNQISKGMPLSTGHSSGHPSGHPSRHSSRHHAKYHSALAMQAARKMRNSKQKQKTGQIVCHHLRMMLTSELLSQSASDESASEESASEGSASENSAVVNDQQYRLGF